MIRCGIMKRLAELRHRVPGSTNAATEYDEGKFTDLVGGYSHILVFVCRHKVLYIRSHSRPSIGGGK